MPDFRLADVTTVTVIDRHLYMLMVTTRLSSAFLLASAFTKAHYCLNIHLFWELPTYQGHGFGNLENKCYDNKLSKNFMLGHIYPSIVTTSLFTILLMNESFFNINYLNSKYMGVLDMN